MGWVQWVTFSLPMRLIVDSTVKTEVLSGEGLGGTDDVELDVGRRVARNVSHVKLS